MVGVEAEVKVTWNNDIEYRNKRMNMKKQGVMMSWRSKEKDEEYSRPIIELVEMKMKHLFIDLNVIHPTFPLVDVDI